MTKEEFKAKLRNCELRLEDVAKAIEEVKQVLIAEAEKPKLGHGDFGINENETGCKSRIFLSQSVEGFDWGKPRGDHREYSEIGVMPDADFTVLGNIFDLMKEWSEDLTEFTYGGVDFKMNGCVLEISIHDEMMTITGLESQMEAWCKFGQLIMTLKRQQKDK